MRKRFKMKRRSCAVCKPFKMGVVKRWKSRDEILLREFERDYK